MIFGDLGGLKFPDICLTDEEKPRKNLTQETCPNRGSNLGPLREKCACYHLLHSGGHNECSLALSLSSLSGKFISFHFHHLHHHHHNHHHHHYHHQYVHHHHHQGVLPKSRSFTANSGTKAAVLLRMNRCGSFLFLSAPHSLFSIWTDLKRSERIPGAATWSWGEWTWLTGTYGLQRNSPQGLNQFHQGFWPDKRSGILNESSLPYLS